MRSFAAILTLLVALAGCSAPAAQMPAPDERGWATPDEPAPGSPAAFTAWPAAQDATIRPGVQVRSETGQCTSNFVFTSPDNATLYLGLAAHCVEGLDIGTEVDIGDVATGVLAYSSWLTMADVGEKDAAVLDANDFALILIPAEARALVHPGMRHFGGPTALADSSSIAMRDKVLTYGNSGLRQEIEPASWHEGYVLDSRDWTSYVYTATPGVPGDSGSGALTGDGQALGVVVTLTILPAAGSNGVTHLDRALEYAREIGGIDVRLATWELENAGLLPGR